MLICAAAAFFITACNSNKVALDSNEWKLKTAEEEVVMPEMEQFTIGFNAQDSSIFGVGACNRYFGNYEISGKGKIAISIEGVTMMTCPDIDLEQPYFDNLMSADSYKIKNGELMLLSGEAVVATFEALVRE